MSNLRPSIAVVLLAAVAALVQIPTAEAQTARSGGTSTDPGGGPGGKLILPGTPGNCGPTLAGWYALDDDDDVQTVWGNYEISDEVMAKL